MECSPSGCSVHGISQARILEWVAISLFWGSSWPRDCTWLACNLGRFFTNWATRKAPNVGIAACYLVCANNWLSFSTHKGSWFPEYGWFPKRRIFFENVKMKEINETLLAQAQGACLSLSSVLPVLRSWFICSPPDWGKKEGHFTFKRQTYERHSSVELNLSSLNLRV